MRFDLHIHSHKSYDSFSSVRSIIHYAKKKQLDGIAITDHGITATNEYDELADENGIRLIKGNELNTDIGDIIGLFIEKPLKEYRAEALIDEIHEAGGIAVLAHPFKYASVYPEKIIRKLDAIETVNARWKDLGKFLHMPKVNELLSAVKGRCAGSDAHFAFEVGRACWITPNLSSQEQLRDSICSNNGIAHADSCSDLLDEASQCVKFMKKPSAMQAARMAYGMMRRLSFVPRRRL